MKTKRLNFLHKRLAEHVRSRYELIRVKPTLGLFNFRCFENVVEYVRRYPQLEVHEVIYMDNGTPILHYVNYDPERKEYLETTLGWRGEFLEYYHIRKIHKDDHRYIQSEFNRSLDSWFHQFATWFDQYILGIDRIV